jgi:hypothetical protein
MLKPYAAAFAALGFGLFPLGESRGSADDFVILWGLAFSRSVSREDQALRSFVRLRP